MRLAIDIDSTLHPYWDQLAEIAQRRFGVELPYDDAVHVGDRPARARAAARRCVEETHTPEHVLAAEPYPGAVETIRAWHDGATSSTSRATAPPTPTRTRASGWTQIGLPHDELYCSYDKITRCVEIGIDVLIDDSPVEPASAPSRSGSPPRRSSTRGTGTSPDVISAPDWPTLAQRLEPVLA